MVAGGGASLAVVDFLRLLLLIVNIGCCPPPRHLEMMTMNTISTKTASHEWGKPLMAVALLLVSSCIVSATHSITAATAAKEEPSPVVTSSSSSSSSTIVPNYWACQDTALTTLYPFCNESLSITDRLEDLVQRLTLEEKVRMLSPDPTLGDPCAGHTGNISRLGLPSYMWLVEANTGVQAACIISLRLSSSSLSSSNNNSSTRSTHHYCATQFSGPLSMAASFNRTSWKRKGQVMGTEQRAFNNLHGHKGSDLKNLIGLTAYGPNINQQRDARFGRSSELPGEDPYLSGQYAMHMVQGLQQKEDAQGRQYPLVLAYLKHFTAYNRETDRGHDDYNISLYDLFDSYLPQFEMAMRGHGRQGGGGAIGVMCSYNGINGYPSCANDWLLNQVLRKRWNAPNAHVTTDCSAISGMIHAPPVYAPDGPTAAAWALMNGTDLEVGSPVWAHHLVQAVKDGLATEQAVNEAFRRSYRPHFVVGRFDNPSSSSSSWTRLGLSDIHSPHHEHVRLEAALQGLVLLKHNHSNPILPLNQKQQHGYKIAVLGPLGQTREGLVSDYANDQNCVGGGYDCIPTLAESIRAVNIHGTTTNASGVEVDSNETSGIQEALDLAIAADIVVLCLGITRAQEHEGMDRTDTALPGLQRMFAKLVFETQTPVILVLVNGGQVALDTDNDDDDYDTFMLLVNKPVAIIEAFNPNDIGGKALAMSLFGLENRWGKLPYTIYPYNVMQGFDMKDHSMTTPPGRTYRYFTGDAIFPFGFGLSYTTFSIHDCQLNQTMLESSSIVNSPQQQQQQQQQQQRPYQFEISCTVENTGHFNGDEVLQVYHRAEKSIRDNVKHPVPLKRLVEFRRVRISVGKRKRVSLTMDAFQALALINEDGDKILYPGTHTLLITNGDPQPSQPIELHVEIRDHAEVEAIQRG